MKTNEPTKRQFKRDLCTFREVAETKMEMSLLLAYKFTLSGVFIQNTIVDVPLPSWS